MAGPFQTRHIGCACRIYRNSSNIILAIDEITVSANIVQIGVNTNVKTNPYPGDMTTSSRWHHQAIMKYERQLFHLDSGSRTIAKIQMLGDYTSVETDSGNYLYAEWRGADTQDKLGTTFSNLPKVGDEI